MRAASIVCCLLAISGCDESVTGPTAPLNSEFTLAPGGAIGIEGAALTVRFNGISGDNRCPADAVCILGGSADVRITVTSERLTRDYELKTGDMRPVQHESTIIALVQVSPYPFSARPIIADEYRVTLKVTRP